nr:penicillin-binding transpeptidase domain-containing protein [uncultured Dysosmobacter sp.]
MKENRTPRLAALAAMLGVILLIYIGVLYNTQVTRHEEYLAKSIHSIAQEEPIEASRGVITDRKGRVMVSNRSVYTLVFDTKLLKEGEDENEAILRLLKLCRGQSVAWTDTLPVSRSAPYTFTLEGLTDSQRKSFLKYLRTLESTAESLEDYILLHPELAEPAEEDEETTDEKDPHSSQEQARELLDRLPASAITGELLTGAGISPYRLLSLMREELEIPAYFSLEESRLVLGIRYELQLRRVGGHTDYTLAQDVNTALISMIADGNYAGAKIAQSTIRKYETDCAAHILGVMGALDPEDLENPFYDDYPMNATVGKSGVEAAFEQYLRGKNGRRVISTNSEGKITGQYYSTEPQPGSTVELTLDMELQETVEALLAQTVQRMNKDGETDRGAAAVVQLVDSGELLAVANYPTYSLSTYRQDIAQLGQDPAKPLYNRATSMPYAPGSTLKPLTAVAALEEGIITPREKLRSPWIWRYPGDPNSYTKCAGGDHGRINVSEAISKSCNYFFAEMGYRLGMDTLREYLSAFGLGDHTGIEIGDHAGTLPENKVGEDQSPWAGYGQANQAYTPLQLANYISTLVSGGVRREAHLLKAVKSYDNSQVLAVGNSEPVSTLELHESTLEAVKKGMLAYTQPGGMVYSYFKDCVVTAGAKTGTAQLGSGQTNNGVFVCFAPYDDPEIAVAIAIEHGGSGAALASTAVQILNAYFTNDQIGTTVVGENQLIP